MIYLTRGDILAADADALVEQRELRRDHGAWDCAAVPQGTSRELRGLPSCLEPPDWSSLGGCSPTISAR